MDHLPGAPFRLTADLPSMLEFSGEFGAELNSFVPFVYWLHSAGLLQDRRILTYGGMRAFYCFLDAAQIIEKPGRRAFVFPQSRPAWLPNRDDHASRRSPFEMFPDYRALFGGDARFSGSLPLLIVHNKFSVEWGRGPVNFLPLEVLSELFSALSARFRIVYLRPGILPPAEGYCGDHQPDLHYADRTLLAKCPDVELFEDLAARVAPGMDYNEVKLRLYASSWFHLTVQGGNAHMTSLFSGNLVAILHRVGQEIRHSYRHGHFAHAANPSPTYLICRTLPELAKAVTVLQQASLSGDRALPHPATLGTVAALSPAAQCGPERMMPPDLRAA